MTLLEPPHDAPNAVLLEWVFGRINDHDIASLRQVWTPGTRVYFPDRTCIGDDEIAAYFNEKVASIAEFQLAVITIAATEDDGFVHWHMTGTHTDRVVGVAGTTKSIELHGMDHFVLADGKVITNTVVFDQLAFARQVGLLPGDGTRTDRFVKGAFNLNTRLARLLAPR